MQGEQVLLRAYLQSADRAPHTPTCERVVKAARHEGLAGATVLEGILGLGSRGLIGSSRWSLVRHVPVVVEIVDSHERIEKFLAGPLDKLMTGHMLTLERAHVMVYRHGAGDRPTALSLAAPVGPLAESLKLRTNDAMKINERGVMLRVFIGESDMFEGKPLHQAIVERVRQLGLSGATVLRGVEGFGAHSVVHKAKLLERSADLPLVIEIVEAEEKINQLLPHLETMVQEGMITMESVMIVLYRDGPAAAGSN